ncbi:MAG: choice-of-anchor tandem repeat GloVer-containing protein [Bryobacteraceae bacterium]
MTRFQCLVLMGSIGVPFAMGRAAAQTPQGTFTTLYSFSTRNGAAQPLTPVTVGNNGVLYGIASYGSGTAFELSPPAVAGGPWTFQVIYCFCPGYPLGDGEDPEAGLVLDSSGTLYGTVTQVDEINGYGAVFELTPPATGSTAWIYTPLFGFGEGRVQDRGVTPWGGVVFGGDGALYGTTIAGGTSNEGTVFELSPPVSTGGGWTETVLHSFTGRNGDGAQPYAGVVVAGDGAVFGTTSYGGASNYGTVYELTPPSNPGTAWTETVLHQFTGHNSDGTLPSGLSMGKSGALYGTTFGGGAWGYGTVFELIPPPTAGGVWKEKALYSFTGQNGDGIGPYSGVIIGTDGALYGATSGGGTANYGTVFELRPNGGGAWTETILHSFTGQNGDGAYPEAGLIFGASGVLYGTTYGGGTAGDGTVFRLTL